MRLPDELVYDCLQNFKLFHYDAEILFASPLGVLVAVTQMVWLEPSMVLVLTLKRQLALLPALP